MPRACLCAFVACVCGGAGLVAALSDVSGARVVCVACVIVAACTWDVPSTTTRVSPGGCSSLLTFGGVPVKGA
ncbi:MAG: hypothetical protein ACK5QX_12345 [bacterium]